MPSHNVHVKWSKQICNIVRPEVDKFLDDFLKELDNDILKECTEWCREEVLKLGIENIETLLEFYESIGINPTRYLQGLLFYTYLDDVDRLKYVYIRLRGHDSWKLFDPCIVLCYVDKKFGKDGIKIATIHMVLDEVARLCKIDFTTARRGAEAIIMFMMNLLPMFDVDTDFLHCMRSRLNTIIIDVAFSVGVNFRNRTIQELIYISDSPRSDIAKYATKILKSNELQSCELYDIFTRLKNVEQRLNVKFCLKFNKILGSVQPTDRELIIVKYRHGHIEHVVAYPHQVKVYPIGDMIIRVEDYLQDLGMMKPGSMTR